MDDKPRNINIIINKILIVIRTHNRTTIPIIWTFRNLQSSLRYMAPELIECNMHWVALINLLKKIFPTTLENKEDPFIKELQDIVNNQDDSPPEIEFPEIQFKETEEEILALKEYGEYRIYFMDCI